MNGRLSKIRSVHTYVMSYDLDRPGRFILIESVCQKAQKKMANAFQALRKKINFYVIAQELECDDLIK